ncbi:hypothetical protein [Hyphomicrobium sp. DY-1]|uniref:hypothetical protein n=1 Tax=Hyphomicrobium sp. DY-1 TaxID=3075650 RepID=UPI0039C48B09
MPRTHFDTIHRFLTTRRRIVTNGLALICADTAPGKPGTLRVSALLALTLLLPLIILVAPQLLVRCPALRRGRR